MPNANSHLQDALISHSLYLLRIAAGQRRAVFKQLMALEADLIRQLENANLTTFRKDRVDRLLKLVQTTIRATFKGIRDSQTRELVDLADLEAQWTARALNGAFSVALPVTVKVTDVIFTPQFLKSVVSDVMVDNELLSSWWAKQAGELRGRIADTIRQGLLQGIPTDGIVRLLRGTKAFNYSDGIFVTSRRNAESLVRTSISAVTADMRMHVYKANEKLLDSVEQISTLDGRTCLTAGSLLAVPGGLKPIESFRVGDVVLGGSGKTRTVVGTKQVRTKKIAVVKLSNGQTIRCTPDHCFLVDEQKWVEAQDLKAGTVLAERQHDHR